MKGQMNPLTLGMFIVIIIVYILFIPTIHNTVNGILGSMVSTTSPQYVVWSVIPDLFPIFILLSLLVYAIVQI